MSLYGHSWWLDVEVMEIQNSLETLEVTDGDEEKTHSSISQWKVGHCICVVEHTKCCTKLAIVKLCNFKLTVFFFFFFGVVGGWVVNFFILDCKCEWIKIIIFNWNSDRVLRLMYIYKNIDS